MDRTGNDRANAECSEIWSAAGHRRFGMAMEPLFFGWFDVQKSKRRGRDPKPCGVPSGSTALQRLFQTDVWF